MIDTYVAIRTRNTPFVQRLAGALVLLRGGDLHFRNPTMLDRLPDEAVVLYDAAAHADWHAGFGQ